MRVLIHAGFQKTGSSAIQSYLVSQRDALEEIGVRYPDFGGNSHWPLGAALGKAEATGYLQRRANKKINQTGLMEAAVERLGHIVTTMDDNSWLLLSHESFASSKQASALRKLLNRNDEPLRIDAIGYVRLPTTYFPSAIQHQLKSGDPYFPTPSDWRMAHIKRAGRLRRVFEEDAQHGRVHLRVHSPSTLVAGDVVEDFRVFASELTGRDFPRPNGVVTANVSLSAPGCALLLRYFDITRNTGKPFRDLRKALFEFQEGRRDAKLKMPDSWLQPLGANAGQEWNALVDSITEDEATRDQLHLPIPPETTRRVSRDEVQGWVRSYADRRFDEDFAEFCRSGPAGDAGKAELSDWVERNKAAA